ncbi:MAG TPA: hypothetical protein VFO41_13200, partial [Alphaproteobacteria bacterium]|nr:hypothetical protein [Alphaproteobacteria bacterium]
AGAAAGKRLPRPTTATDGAPDDLKMIVGIGPGLERTLNDMGIATFAQLAALTPGQIGDLEARLNFRGRIARDRWTEQASALARGGVEEYRRVFGKDPG